MADASTTMTRALLAAAAVLALLVPAAAAAAPSPQRSARITASCLRDRDWTASVHGRTVTARSPRVRPRNSFPRRPRYQVTFYDLGAPPLEITTALNRTETNQTIHCRNRGLQG
jgi:hypothetical protein